MKKSILSSLLVCLLYLQVYSQSLPNIWVPTTGTNTYGTFITSFGSSYSNKIAYVRFTNTNTGASSININTMGAIPLRKWNGSAWVTLDAGDIKTDRDYRISYDNTNLWFRLELIPDGGTGGSGVASVSGTANRIQVGGTATDPVVDIASTYTGQSSINTVGALSAGSLAAGFTAVPATVGGTGQTTVNIGDILYGSASNTWSKLPAVAVGSYLASTGTSTAPRWDAFPYVTPEMYGAVGDGSTDDQAAITVALATGKTLLMDGSKHYRVNSSVTVPSDAVIMGNGALISTTSNIGIFICSPSTNAQNAVIRDLNFLGNNTGAGQLGLNVSTYRMRVSNCTFRNFTYAGIYVTQTAGVADYEGGIMISDCYFENNAGRGLYLYTAAEYNNISNCTSRGNGYGITIRGGNNNWVGGKITDNGVGVELVNGTNDGHGSVVGALINHNTSTVTATGITNNFLFADNMFYAGTFTLSNNTGIRFDGNEFGGTGGVITLTNNTITEFSNNKFVTDFTFSITGTAPKFFNNTFSTGTIPAAVTNSLAGKLDLTANIPNGLTTTGSYTTTASGQSSVSHGGTVATRATSGDQFSFVKINPVITPGATSQTIYALEVDASGVGTGNGPTKYAIKARGGIDVSTDASATATPTLKVNTTASAVLADFQSSGSSIFSISTVGTSTVATIAGSGSNALGFIGNLVTSAGSSAMVAMNATTTAGANNDVLRVLRGFNTWNINTRTGVKTYFAHYNPTVSISTGTHTGHYGFVADNTLYSTAIRNGFNAGADPTAQLHLGASTTAAGTGSIKINEGSRLTTPEDGNLNYVSNNLEFTESTTVYILAKTLTTTSTLDFGSTAAGTSTDLTVTLTGASSGDVVSIGIPSGSIPDNGAYTAWVSAADTITIRFSNNDLSASKDPASGTYRVTIIKY
jgi:hypothetical protein